MAPNPKLPDADRAMFTAFSSGSTLSVATECVPDVLDSTQYLCTGTIDTIHLFTNAITRNLQLGTYTTLSFGFGSGLRLYGAFSPIVGLEFDQEDFMDWFLTHLVHWSAHIQEVQLVVYGEHHKTLHDELLSRFEAVLPTLSVTQVHITGIPQYDKTHLPLVDLRKFQGIFPLLTSLKLSFLRVDKGMILRNCISRLSKAHTLTLTTLELFDPLGFGICRFEMSQALAGVLTNSTLLPCLRHFSCTLEFPCYPDIRSYLQLSHVYPQIVQRALQHRLYTGAAVSGPPNLPQQRVVGHPGGSDAKNRISVDDDDAKPPALPTRHGYWSHDLSSDNCKTHF